MKVEMYVINSDNTWSTEWIEIPDDTEEHKVKEVAEEKLLKILNDKKVEVDGVAVRFYEKN